MNRKLSILRLGVVILVVVAWSRLAFGGEIHDAAAKGDLEKVKVLLKANPDLVNSKDNLGETPLNCAALRGHRDVAELLLVNKADVDTTNKFGWTPLQTAAYHGYKDIVELLLTNKADISAMNNQGETPLHMAAMKGYKDVAELLLANKADVNARDNYGATPLIQAAGAGHKDVAELLLANKADVNAKSSDGRTPLHEAAMGGHKDVAELLLASKADINARNNKGETPLHMVLAQATDSRYTPETELGKRNKDMVELLVASNADANAKDNNGSTPLDHALPTGLKDIINLLRQHGATNYWIGEKFVLTAKDVDPETVQLVATNSPRPNLVFKFIGKTSDEIQAIGQNHRWVQIMNDGTNVTETAWVSIYQHQKTNYGLVLIFDDYKEAKLAEKTLRGE